MTLKLSILRTKPSMACTAISDNVQIPNMLVFNKIICEKGEVVSFHDEISSILKGRYLTKVHCPSDNTTAYKWFYSLKDALVCYGLGEPNEEQTAQWRLNEQRHYESSQTNLNSLCEPTGLNTINP